VLVLEKTEWFGGATAISGGGILIPGNHLAQAAGLPDRPAPPGAI
jgi:3-oxosteroid 1-dehydrogenase